LMGRRQVVGWNKRWQILRDLPSFA
jgi:hypothetical protein